MPRKGSVEKVPTGGHVCPVRAAHQLGLLFHRTRRQVQGIDVVDIVRVGGEPDPPIRPEKGIGLIAGGVGQAGPCARGHLEQPQVLLVVSKQPYKKKRTIRGVVDPLDLGAISKTRQRFRFAAVYADGPNLVGAIRIPGKCQRATIWMPAGFHGAEGVWHRRKLQLQSLLSCLDLPHKQLGPIQAIPIEREALVHLEVRVPILRPGDHKSISIRAEVHPKRVDPTIGTVSLLPVVQGARILWIHVGSADGPPLARLGGLHLQSLVKPGEVPPIR